MHYTLYQPELRPEINRNPSTAIPDMTMSIQEILRQSRIGTLPAELVRSVLYDESDDFDSVLAENVESYDLVDKERELSKLRQKFYSMRNMPDPALSKNKDSGGGSGEDTATAETGVDKQAQTSEK